MTIITQSKPEPLEYERVRQAVVEMIDGGKFAPGDRLPSERKLAQQLGCHYNTVRKGLAMLEKEHRIERRVGSGTFVLSPELWFSRAEDKKNIAARSTTIGLLCPSRMNSFAAEIIEHLHEQANQRGYQIVIRTVSDFRDAAFQAVKGIADQGARAIIVPWIPPNATGDIHAIVDKVKLPIVLPKLLPGLEAYFYECPDLFGRIEYEIAERIYGYFERLGYGHIAFLGSDLLGDESLAHRLTAYSRAASRHGQETLIGLVGTDANSVDMLVRRWEQFKGDLAIMCYDDDHAIRLLMALHKRNLRIPEDVAVMGFNNTPASVLSDPPLSTVQFDYDYVARGMIVHALALADGRSEQASGDIRESLIIRESCGGRRRAGNNAEDLFSNNTNQ